MASHFTNVDRTSSFLVILKDIISATNCAHRACTDGSHFLESNLHAFIPLPSADSTMLNDTSLTIVMSLVWKIGDTVQVSWNSSKFASCGIGSSWDSSRMRQPTSSGYDSRTAVRKCVLHSLHGPLLSKTGTRRNVFHPTFFQMSSPTRGSANQGPSLAPSSSPKR